MISSGADTRTVWRNYWKLSTFGEDGYRGDMQELITMIDKVMVSWNRDHDKRKNDDISVTVEEGCIVISYITEEEL